MTDKQKIRQWISREQDGLMDPQGNFQYPKHEGAYNILCSLEAFIDSMPEEPAAEYSFNIPSEIFHQLTPEQQKLWKKEIEQAYNAGMKQKDEPENDDLEIEIDNYIKENGNTFPGRDYG